MTKVEKALVAAARKKLERIAFCGAGYHNVINAGLHTFDSGVLDKETAWKVAWDDRCERCRHRMWAAEKAYLAGLKAR
jgi:hypothetical protein